MYVSERAARSVALSFSGVEMSGTAAPLRTASPMETIARSRRVAASTSPSRSSEGSISAGTTSTSGRSPAARRFAISPAGAYRAFTAWPVSRSQGPLAASSADFTAPPASTVTSSA